MKTSICDVCLAEGRGVRFASHRMRIVSVSVDLCPECVVAGTLKTINVRDLLDKVSLPAEHAYNVMVKEAVAQVKAARGQK